MFVTRRLLARDDARVWAVGVSHAVLMRVGARLLAAILVVSQLAVPSARAYAQDQSGGACDDLSNQIDAANQDLDQLKQDALPWLLAAQQFGAIAPSELATAAAQGVPGLQPELAATYGALAAQVGALIGGWQAANQSASSASYLSDLSTQLLDWETRLAVTAPVRGFVQSLNSMSTALSELDQLGAKATADRALRDSLTQAFQDCQNGQQPDTGPIGGGPTDGSALCAVGGKSGFSNSECFTLELDAAFEIWKSCTEAYFAAERAAWQNGGDLPVNTCDGPWQEAQDTLNRKWVKP